MVQAQLPEDISADYENLAVREALTELHAAPDYSRLVTVLEALREGYLFSDVTGSASPAAQGTKKSARRRGTRVRTLRSTTGQLVLPLFTSMVQLRGAVTDVQQDQLRGALMPSREALNLIASDRFTAAEFDKGAPHSLVLLRKYVSLAAGDEPLTLERLEAMR